MAGRIHIDYKLFHKAFRSDARYRNYLRRLAREAIALMIEEFLKIEIPFNDAPSPTTPPKYIQSFGYELHLERGSVSVYNDDPAWNMVEWGAHAYGKHWVLGYKPMTRGFALLAGNIPPPHNLVDPRPGIRDRSEPSRFKPIRRKNNG